MTITIYGAGAIGGVTGAALARAGHDVVLVDRAEDHVAAMNAHGLTIESREGSVTVPVRAITPGALGHGLGLVLLAVKSQDTSGALEVLTPRLAADGAIVSLQNGLNEELIAEKIGAPRTVGCLVNWAADWVAPGRILHGGHGALVLGELDGRMSDRVQGLAKLLAVVAPTEVTDNVLGYTWAKHVYGALLVATAVVDAHVYEVVERSPAVQQMLVALVVENMRAAEAAGIRLEPFDEYAPADYRAAARGDLAARQRAMEIIARHYRQHTKTKTGIWRDLVVRRRKTEVGALLGATVAKARMLGLDMPLTERLIAMIEDLERGRRVMSWDNIDELVAASRRSV
ncbi:MAG: 2-dehydropantoate 2-reductase [Candidatus Rokuibacteriota bacterium]|jgi:2-dehydropantoate 2-reductase|nr:MAG: 2-dehydropantoate 2-reductase [Candidatus Rokubacteria bacterium]